MKRLMIFIIGLSFVYVFTGIAYADSAKIQNPDNGHWYQRIDTIIRWHNAKAHCETLGGHLVTISSAQENSFVNALYNARTVGGGWNWLGATDERIEGLWEWVTGEDWGYTNWAPGEPNNLYPEHWLIMYSNGTWNDVFGSGFIGGKFYDNVGVFICEWDLIGKVVPELDYDTNDNSRTLVNGTCWKFTADPDQGQPNPYKVKWMFLNQNNAKFFNDSTNSWEDTASTENTGTHEIWVKAGLDDCEIHAEGFDPNNLSLGAFEYATVHVKNILGLKQSDIRWKDDWIGFWNKDIKGIPKKVYAEFSPQTIAKWGCNLTCYAMLSHYYGGGYGNYCPDNLNDLFKSKKFSNDEFGYYKGPCRYLPTFSSPNSTPPLSAWEYDIQLSPMTVLDIDNPGWPGIPDEGDAKENPIFDGGALKNNDGWAVWESTRGEAQFEKRISVDMFDSVVDRLKQKQPIPSLVQVYYFNNQGGKNHHWVLAVGISPHHIDPQLIDIMILDPAKRYPDTPYNFDKTIYFLEQVILITKSGSKPSNKGVCGVSCNAQLLIRDASGLKAGVLPNGEHIDEIGGALYEVQDEEGIVVSYKPELFSVDGHKSLTLDLDTPQLFDLTVIGTGPGPYFISTSLTDESGEVYQYTLEGGTIDEGVKWKYTCYMDPIIGQIDGELVPPTTNSMSYDIDAYWANGDITNQGIAKSLKAKLEAAERAISRGNIKAASNVLNAFINEVEAQREKHIVAKAANDLIFHANYINLNLE